MLHNLDNTSQSSLTLCTALSHMFIEQNHSNLNTCITKFGIHKVVCKLAVILVGTLRDLSEITNISWLGWHYKRENT